MSVMFLTMIVISAAPSAQIVVKADQPGHTISPSLYGIFFEEINCSGDGGLYAELVRNRSFEDSDNPDHWAAYSSGSRHAQIAIDTQNPMSQGEFNRRSLRMTIADEGEGRAGVVNEGYWGIAIEKGAQYDFSCYARIDGPGNALRVSLESANGTVYASDTLTDLKPRWSSKLTRTLTSEATDPAARLVISTDAPGAYWLDVVSLVPKKTWKDRPNGLRPDLAEMLAGLHPSFVRFPGGCWVEGDTLQFSQHWKHTIGDVAERRTQYNLWQYYSTNGLGFHEYLQMCEDLGAEPLFVINCGMSHKENVPLDHLGPWVQDALDAIEYANGPVDSHWGGARRANGHDQPFNLKYMEIGNENGGAAYEERFPRFYDAIKAKYPEIQLIANEPVKCRKPDIIDEHYYPSPEFFIANATKYDSYDRSGPKIYVGEYAVTQHCGQGNLRAAIGEAAFMTGLERNSDIVAMASYAPLFANINYKKWNPDLIDFDGSRVYGIPSYYVQKMFSEYRGDVVLPVEVTQPSRRGIIPRLQDAPAGAIGLSTWATQAEFKDIKVTHGDEVLFKSDFSKDADGWKPISGKWDLKDGAYRQTDNGMDNRALAGNVNWTDYTYSLKARKLGGAEGFLILFHVKNKDNWVWWNLGGWGNVKHAFEASTSGGKTITGSEVPGTIETGRWYDIRIELQGDTIRGFLDGKLISEVKTPQLQPIHTVASRNNATQEIILKIVNVANEEIVADLNIGGVKGLEPKATAIVLANSDPDAENSITEPKKVFPETKEITVAPSFKCMLPAHSLTVMGLKEMD